MLNFGILGAGDIAHAMATTISQMKSVNMYAIASRSMEKAEKYQKQYGMEKAYGSYEELAQDEKVDVIYIATPHSFHYEQARMCLNYGKHVLCEKAFTVNAQQAEGLIKLSEQKGLFLGEAMWTRFMPITEKLAGILNDRIIGEVTYMTANLNFPMMNKARLVDPMLAGGALLDVGVYPLTMAAIVMGKDIKDIRTTAVLTEEGVDKMGQYTLLYKSGKIADLNGGMCSFGDGNAVIYGTAGHILVEGVNCPQRITVFDCGGNVIKQLKKEKQISGYEYEIEACARAIQKGALECPQMPHSETLRMMKLMDKIREKMGVKYPFEQ